MRNLFVRVTVAVSGFGVLAGGLLVATGQAQGPARSVVHVGRSSPVHLVRRVNVRGLPAPTHHPVISVEPNETAPRDPRPAHNGRGPARAEEDRRSSGRCQRGGSASAPR